MNHNFAQSDYKKPVLKTHGTLEEMTKGGFAPVVGSAGCSPGKIEFEGRCFSEII